MKNKQKNSYERNLKKSSSVIIKEILPDSIAEEVEIEESDKILSINSKPVKDELDFFYLTATEELLLEIQKADGEIWLVEIEKDSDEELGIVLEDTLEAKVCSNHCVFCFIDQMPPGMRSSLYVKDDDERLSFLTGNYITLTNLSDYEIERICNWKIPINVSIHTTDPILRTKMLRNKNAGDLLKIMNKFNEAGVQMNAQIVLVPEYNDKDLISSLKDLADFYPNLQTVSVVPVGLTKYRDKLSKLRKFTKEEAKEIIKNIKALKESFKEYGIENFVYLSDEFYLLAEQDFPDYLEYNGFEQLENGVGMITDFNHDFNEELENSDKAYDNKKRTVITGKLAQNNLENLVKVLKNKFPKAQIDILGVNNNFFGKNITVSGLLTGQDILKEFENYDLENIDEVLFPDSLVKNDTEILLDDYKISDIEQKINKPIKLVPVNGRAFYRALIGDRNG